MKTFAMSLVLLFAGAAFANDGGMPYIKIDDLTFKNADIGTTIEFHGPEAASLFNVLPSQFVYGTRRGFTATGKKKAVVIECQSHVYNEKRNEDVKVENGPQCQIRVTAAFDPAADEADNSPWVVDRAPQSVDKKAKKETKKKK